MINIFAFLSTKNLFKATKFDQISKDIGQLIKILRIPTIDGICSNFHFLQLKLLFEVLIKSWEVHWFFFYEGAQNLQFFLKYNIFPYTVSQPDLFTYCLRNF